MKKEQLESIFGKGRVFESDGVLTVVCIYQLGLKETLSLNRICQQDGSDYEVKPSSDCVSIKIRQN